MYDRETGLYAPWYLERRFEEEARRAERFSHPLSLIAIEVRCRDDAYRVQDGLRNWLHQSLRETDLATHLGGGRYLALVTETGLEDAFVVAARIAERFPQRRRDRLGLLPCRRSRPGGRRTNRGTPSLRQLAPHRLIRRTLRSTSDIVRRAVEAATAVSRSFRGRWRCAACEGAEPPSWPAPGRARNRRAC